MRKHSQPYEVEKFFCRDPHGLLIYTISLIFARKISGSLFEQFVRSYS